MNSLGDMDLDESCRKRRDVDSARGVSWEILLGVNLEVRTALELGERDGKLATILKIVDHYVPHVSHFF